MPVRYAIDKEQRLVISTGWDCVTFAEAKAHQDQLLGDPDFDPDFSQLLDMRAVTGINLLTDEGKTLANRKVFSKTSRRAWVASNVAIFGIGRMLETYHEMSSEPSQVSVFSDLPSALKWLGLESLL